MKINKYIGEIFSLVEQESSEEEKIKILRENSSPALFSIIKFAYEPTYVSLIKEIPEYKPDDSPYGYSYSDLTKEYHRLNYFFDYPDKNKSWIINAKQMNKMLFNILERIHWSDSAILSDILTKRKIPNIPLKLIKKAFPQLEITKKGTIKSDV